MTSCVVVCGACAVVVVDVLLLLTFVVGESSPRHWRTPMVRSVMRSADTSPGAALLGGAPHDDLWNECRRLYSSRDLHWDCSSTILAMEILML